MRASLTIWGVLFLSGFLMQLFPQEKRVGILTGIVIDFETKQPIPGVNVMVENTYFGSATDSKGRFMIREIPAGNYDVKFSAVDYEQTKVEVIIFPSIATNITVEMKPLASKKGKFSYDDPNYSRLLFAQTGRPLRQGNAYFSDIYIYIFSLSV